MTDGMQHRCMGIHETETVINDSGETRQVSVTPGGSYYRWEGTATPETLRFAGQGNGPYWVIGDELVIGLDAEGEETLRVPAGEWVTYCGDGLYVLGQVIPVYSRIGWGRDQETCIGWIEQPEKIRIELAEVLEAMATMLREEGDDQAE